ncbi:M1 family metallopeptidase [Gracilimonas sediminicola]|uniref:Aminopeptidase N n=1 Tax=Gracilimonas sediminicola TaxID=2952158 RepID=A0A9X2L227_9BACT|nr:M1 family aminopeptidase [Gracilimonas sediminicola]MCP9290799.1 M1 family aminopeptidase [Gracilimonas sediminicola]
MTKIRTLFISLLIFGTLGCSTSPKVEPGVSLELAKFRKALISDVNYELFFNIPGKETEDISASETITFTLKEAGHDIQLDFRESAELLKSLTINGSESEIKFKDEHLILPSHLLKEGLNSVTIDFIAGESSLNRNPDYLYTLFVPDRARTAFPLFDQPDLKATYDLTLEIPVSWEAISNAPLASVTEKDSAKTLEFATSDLISSYLFSFVAGDFEAVSRIVNGREMTMLHRETDEEKVARSIDKIFELHAASLNWLEEYTGIDYPFQKFDFALIPAFQYGGMEHVGAIQYRASSLFLDVDPSESQLLSRASLIAHETAHMWFGDLVTMEWFNDVWTKEVFANFMAAKIMNPNFPDIDHDLNFVLRHHPSAYSVDRTEGANPIRQHLENLNEAGQMYGAIIYNKAPIMMRQLELLVGEELFKKGLREYLSTYSFGNATWPDLITILDQKTEQDLHAWSEVWVNTAGRPHFSVEFHEDDLPGREPLKYDVLVQSDPAGLERVWPQQVGIWTISPKDSSFKFFDILSDEQKKFATLNKLQAETRVFNANGRGYGLFPADLKTLQHWEHMRDVRKGSHLINLYENMLEQNEVFPDSYLDELVGIFQTEENQLLLNLALGHIETIYWKLLTEEQRNEVQSGLEEILWNEMLAQTKSSTKKTFFNTFRDIALSDNQVQKVYDVWSGELEIDGLNLAETDFISMAGDLAIKRPDLATSIISEQLSRIENPDRKRRFEFIQPALSADQNVRDSFFESLKDEGNRKTESWVLSALGYLHHPLRVDESEKYILPSLEVLREIQTTGDIFFPKRWLDVTLGNHSSDEAVKTVRTFLDNNPDYNRQLKMKILQAADMMFRANEIKQYTK